ncbi:MAG TPA: AI-2E family transporter [Miltoncostaeaceae bacterium]|nr:AI-2E family transporter [Miltoncostaeaceae bacterium]
MAEPPTITEPPEAHPRTMAEMIERAPSREILVRPRTLLVIAATVLAVALVVWVLLEAWQVVSWIFIAILFAIALQPAVDFLERRGMPNGAAVTLVSIAALALVGLLAWAVIPPLVSQTTELIQAIPGAIDDITAGRGPLGFLQTDYGLADRAREFLEGRSSEGVLGVTSPALEVLRGILTAVVATVTIFFMVFFLLREGRRWVNAGVDLLPPASRPRWERVLAGVTRTIRGYVTGNLLISLIAGLVAYVTLFALGVPYALPLALLVALLDLIPLVGATLGTVLAAGVALSEGLFPCLVVVAVFIVYQQIENHLLQPLIYGRTVQLSPLMVLISILLAGSIAGVIGALIAIPIAGSLQVVVIELLAARRERLQARWSSGPD